MRPTPDGARLARRAIVAVADVDARFFDREAGATTAILQRLVAAQAGPPEAA